MKVHEQWYQEAKKVTIDTLPAFVKKLTEDYAHDYGTICHAVAAAAIAGGNAIEHSPTGGITVFQASCVMWEFIRHWQYSHNKTGLRIVDYDDFLYPQSADRYDKTISADTWQAIQKEAKAKLKEADADREQYRKDKEAYDSAIADYVARHPDYHENRAQYDHLGCGTSDEWAAEKKKEESGFEFAPHEPFYPVHPEVYGHWKSIVGGKVPFDYRIVN